MIELIIAVTGVLLSVLIPLTRYIYGRRRKLEVYYENMWEKSPKLNPGKVLGIRGRGFDEYYYKRPVDDIIKKKIESNQNVLIIGGPLSGKSRAIWQALTTLKKPHDIIIPRSVDINPEDFHVPFRFTFWRKPILVIDDIDRFVEKRNFSHLLQEFLEYKAIIVASCRSGPEYDKLKTRIETELLSAFGDPINIPEIPKAEAEKIADFAKREFPATFDGNVGSIFMQLDAMKERYQHCSVIEKGILRSISRLQAAGFDAEKGGGFFQIEEIKHVCINKEEINLKQYEWVEWLKELEKKGFIEVVGDEVRVEMAYFTGGVIEARYDTWQNLNDMMELFPNDFRKLASVGFKAYVWGNFLYKAIDYVERTEKGKGYSAKSIDHLRSFYKIAINAFEKALKKWPTEHLRSLYYPMVHYNLGLVHVILAALEPENRTEHCKEATKAYDEVLRISRRDGIPETHIHRYSLLGANLKEYLDFCKDQPKAKDETEREHTFLELL